MFSVNGNTADSPAFAWEGMNGGNYIEVGFFKHCRYFTDRNGEDGSRGSEIKYRLWRGDWY